MNQPIQQTALDALRTHAKTFQWASFFLSKEERLDAAITYAFCRHVDDLVDDTNDPEQARTELDRLECMLTGEEAPNALLSAYQEVANRARFGLSPALDLLRGARSDLSTVRVGDTAELDTYCYRVAGTVGLMMCGILGVTNERAYRYAVDLGIGMQLTNICRDVLEDAVNNRVYLPESLLRQAGTSHQRLLSLLRDSAVGGVSARTQTTTTMGETATEPSRRAIAAVVSDLLTRADAKYESAQSGYPYLPPRARLSIMVAAEIYRHIGVILRLKNGCDPLFGRVTVGPSKKVALTAKTLVKWAGVSSGVA